MKIAAVQMKLEPDFTVNMKRGEKFVKEGIRKGANLICFPELFPYQYFPGNRVKASLEYEPEYLDGQVSRFMGNLAKRYNVWILSGLYEKNDKDQYFNTAFLLNPNGIVTKAFRKLHVPNLEWAREKDYFENGSLESIVAQVENVRVSVAICYDRHFPEVARIAALEGAHGIVFPVASVSRIGRVNTFQAELISRGIENNIYVLGINRVGNEGGGPFYGTTTAVDPSGQIIGSLDSDGEGVLVVEWNPKSVEEVQGKFRHLLEMREDTFKRILQLLLGQKKAWSKDN